MNACEAGYRVKFYTAVNLAAELAEAVQMNRLSRFEKALNRKLLIIDELSYLTFNRYQSEMLFQVISERSERSSVIITTNLELSEWTQLFDNEMMLAALIDIPQKQGLLYYATIILFQFTIGNRQYCLNITIFETFPYIRLHRYKSVLFVNRIIIGEKRAL